MDLTQPEFLFILLPFLFIIYLAIASQYKKWALLIASVGIYIWFQRIDSIPLFILIGINYGILSIAYRRAIKNGSNTFLTIFVIFLNTGVFSFFRIFSTQNIFRALSENHLGKLPFEVLPPLGFSFIIFQMLACYFDTDRKPENYPSNFGEYVLYLLFFPKILMGPINRWPAFAQQIKGLGNRTEQIRGGVKRFIIGFAKKAMIANHLAVIVTAGFNLPNPTYTTGLSWLIILCFFFQIYFDFSGYIDMALGVAAIFGINLPENFDHPYLATSVTDFWRRWHMSLTGWFRDYVFFPLEFARKKFPILIQPVNIMIIFALTGIWHGFNLNYLLWGLLQGLAIVFESSRMGKRLTKLPGLIQRLVLFVFLIISWVIFRSPGIPFTIQFLKNLFIFNNNPVPLPFNITDPLPVINNSIYLILIYCSVSLLPLKKWLTKGFKVEWKKSLVLTAMRSWGVDVLYVCLFVAALAFSASQKFIPSVYQQF